MQPIFTALVGENQWIRYRVGKPSDNTYNAGLAAMRSESDVPQMICLGESMETNVSRMHFVSITVKVLQMDQLLTVCSIQLPVQQPAS